MPLYSDPAGYYYSTGSSSGVYSTPYSAPYYTTSSPYVGGSSYGRPYSIPSLTSYSSSTSSRYQPKLSTITETPLGSRGLIPLTRLNSPKIITTTSSSSYHHHHTPSKYIPPRPININTADIDVSASRYRRRDLKSPKSSPKSTSSSTIKQANESSPTSTPIIQVSTSSAEQELPKQCQQSATSPYMPRADGTDPTPDLNRSTIKRNRAVVRLSTLRSKSIRDRSIPRSSKMVETEKDVNDHKKPKIESSKLMNSEEKANESIENNSSTSWRDKFGDDLAPKPFGVIKKSPGELLLERYIIPSKYNKDEVFVNSINVTPPADIQNEIEKTDSNSEIMIELDPFMQSAIRRLSIPKCPDFQDFCEDISSDKIDDDLNAGDLRRRASLIQEQEIELFNQLQKSASGSFQLIHLERNESGSDLTTDNGNRKSTKRKSLTKKPKKVRHKITATVDVQNPTLTPIIQESFDEDNVNLVPTKTVKPKFTFNVDEIEENHTIHQIFKLPKKKSIEISTEIQEEEKVDEQNNKSLEKIELKKGIKNSPKKIKITKKTDPIKGVKSSPKKRTTEFKEENSKGSETIEKINDKISEIVTDLKSKPNETITAEKLTLIDTKSDKISDKKDNKDSGILTPKTPIIKKKPITPKPLEILKLKKSDENKTVSPSTKSPIKKISSPLNITKSDIRSQITPEHFKFDEDSIKETEKQSPIIQRSGKHPISPLAIDHMKNESPEVSVDIPKTNRCKIQKSDSTDFWTEIGSSEQLISPLAIDNKKTESLKVLVDKPKTREHLISPVANESGVSVAKPKPIIGKIQRSDSGEDFWTQIGSRETLYMSKRKRNVIESQWEKRETLLDNQTIDDVKNLQEIKTKVHDQKNEALKQADEQNGSVELGKRAHSNESALCAKKKGLVKKEHEDSLEEDKSKNILQKEVDNTENRNLEKLSLNILNENEINKKNHQIKSKEIPKKIPDSNETYKKLNQSFTTTPTYSEKSNTTTAAAASTTTKIPEQNQKNTTANIPKIETRLNAKSPEIKSKEIDLNINKLDPQKSAPPSPEFETSVSTIKSNVAGTIVVPTPKTPTTTIVETNNLPSSGLKKKKDNNKNKDEQIKIKKTSNDSVLNNDLNHDISKIEYGSPATIVAEVAEQHESKENVSLQKLITTSTTSSPQAPVNITDNKQQKKISPPTTLKTPQSPALDKLSSTDTKISSTTTTTPTKIDNKNKKPPTSNIKLDEKIGKIPDNKNICNDANSIDKIEENITNKIKGNNNKIKEIENHQQQQQKPKENENEKQHNEENNEENQQHFEHQLSCKNVLMKFATVNNLNQCLLDVDADIEDIIEENNNSDSEDNYSSYSSDNNNKDLSESMKRKDKKNKHKHQQKEEKQFNRNKVKLDHTKKCYVKDEAPPYPLIATPRPLWKPEKFIIPESDTDDDDDDDSDTDNSDNDNNDGGGSDNECSTSSGSSTDDELDDELNPNKSAIIRMSTCSNDSGFEGGTAPSSPKKMLETSYTYAQFQKSGRITAPATNIPRFKKYSVEDFHFLTVLGKGSFGKVLLAELRNTDYYYAVKCLKKDVVLEDDDVECTLIERKVLALGTKHPYLCHLFCTFQTESHLFFVMEYLNGGDLMFHIQQSGRFPEPRARFYAAEIISGLKFLHKKGIIYRDLKLDNVLLDFDGHVRIADFGMCKLQIYLDKTADSFCGTPDYMAPEIIKGDNYNQNVDWWSFGVLLYEMLIGQSPFSGCDEEYLFWSICNEMPLYPLMLSQESTSLLKALLEKDSNKRIGSQYSPAGDIYSHPFFNQIEWDRLEKRQIEPPFKPQVKHPLDTQYFDKTFTRERVRLTPIDKDILQSMDQAQFQGFSYTNPNATLE